MRAVLLAIAAVSALGSQVGKDAYKVVLASGTVEIAGVCSESGSSLDCWTPAGRRDAELTELIRAFFLVHDQPIPMRPGRKNRYIVIQTEPRDESIRGLTAQLESAERQPLSSCGSLTHAGGVSYGLYHLMTERDVRAVSLRLKVAEDGGKDVRMVPKIGVETHVGPGMIKLTDIVESKPPKLGAIGFDESRTQTNRRNAGLANRWRLTFDLTGIPSESRLHFVAENAKFQPIVLVKDNGDPVAGDASAMPQYIYPPDVQHIFFHQFHTSRSGETVTLMSPMNPAKIPFLQVHAYVSSQQLVDKIALDP